VKIWALRDTMYGSTKVVWATRIRYSNLACKASTPNLVRSSPFARRSRPVRTIGRTGPGRRKLVNGVTTLPGTYSRSELEVPTAGDRPLTPQERQAECPSKPLGSLVGLRACLRTSCWHLRSRESADRTDKCHWTDRTVGRHSSPSPKRVWQGAGRAHKPCTCSIARWVQYAVSAGAGRPGGNGMRPEYLR
jgi:hypothetical protein